MTTYVNDPILSRQMSYEIWRVIWLWHKTVVTDNVLDLLATLVKYYTHKCLILWFTGEKRLWRKGLACSLDYRSTNINLGPHIRGPSQRTIYNLYFFGPSINSFRFGDWKSWRIGIILFINMIIQTLWLKLSSRIGTRIPKIGPN